VLIARASEVTGLEDYVPPSEQLAIELVEGDTEERESGLSAWERQAAIERAAAELGGDI
jgi:hypothetical protein